MLESFATPCLRFHMSAHTMIIRTEDFLLKNSHCLSTLVKCRTWNPITRPNFLISSAARSKLTRNRQFSAIHHEVARLEARYQSINVVACSRSSAIGFSDSTCFPADSAALMNEDCVPIGRLRPAQNQSSVIIADLYLRDDDCGDIFSF